MILLRIPRVFFVFDKLRITFKSLKKYVWLRLDFVAKSLMTFCNTFSSRVFLMKMGIWTGKWKTWSMHKLRIYSVEQGMYSR